MEEEKPGLNPRLLIALGVAAVVAVAFLIWKVATGTSTAAPATIIKPDNPNDPKYRPNPNLGLGGGNS